jgi:hypothetical protein
VVWLGDSTGPDPRLRFQPAAPERIQPAMRALDQLLARSGDPIIVAALASAQLPAIHPWSDGNGRIGRLLGDLVLSRACDGGRAPDVARELALRWGDAAVVIDAWLIDGMLDEWIAVWCAALVRAADRPAGGVKTAGKWWRRRR